MSHESIASLWSALCDAQDLTACIRDATGQCVLNLSALQADSTARRDVLLTYALELIAILDLGRTSQNAKPLPHSALRVTISLEPTLSALTFLLHNFTFEIPTQDSQTSHLSCTYFVIVRVILSAICTLRAFAGDRRPTEAEYVVTAARAFVSRLADGQEELSLMKALCQYLINEFSPPTDGQEKHITSQWTDTCDAVGRPRYCSVQPDVCRPLETIDRPLLINSPTVQWIQPCRGTTGSRRL